MTIDRRRCLQALALGGGVAGQTEAQAGSLPLEVLRNVCKVHGTELSDERLKVIRPALERRLEEVQRLRDFEMDEGAGPTQGILAD